MAPLLISNLVNIRYLSGVEMTAGVMLVHAKKKILFIDDRYTEKAKKEKKRGIQIQHIKDLGKYIKRFKRVRFESDDLTVARLLRWKKRFRGTKLMSSENVIEEMRREKTKYEIDAIKKACHITDKVLKMIPRKLKTGITERELAWEIERLSRELGAEALSFETIVGFGEHTARPHHTPTNKKLKKHDIVQIDMGVKVNGYCSDCSRVFFKGKPTSEQKKIFDLLVRTVKTCTKSAKNGASNHALDTLARKMLGEYNKYFTHGLGHGVGLNIHEGASLSMRAPKQKLKTNEIITIEPGIYLSERWGMRIEDTIIISAKGGIPLTKARF